MAPFIHELSDCLSGSVCLVGLGNPDLCDDGFGLWMVNAIAQYYFSLAEKVPPILDVGDHCQLGDVTLLAAGRSPENWISFLSDGVFDHILFIDAVDVGKPPGTIAWLNAQKIKQSCNSVSTHKLSLSAITQLIEGAQVWLLGVQPAALSETSGLTQTVQKTADALDRLFQDLLCETANSLAPDCIGGAS
jgi:hydrogenase maturation protease